MMGEAGAESSRQRWWGGQWGSKLAGELGTEAGLALSSAQQEDDGPWKREDKCSFRFVTGPPLAD